MQLISSPAKAWEEIRLEDGHKALTTFVYPMIGLCALSVVIGVLWQAGWDKPIGFQMAMRRCCEVAVSLFGGYYLAAYLLNTCCVRWFNMNDNFLLLQQFTAYAMVVILGLKFIEGILPDFSILALLLNFYTVYVVWEGAVHFLSVSENQRLHFTVIASITLMLCPFVIDRLFMGMIALTY